MLIAGARPNFMKIASIVDAIKLRNDFIRDSFSQSFGRTSEVDNRANFLAGNSTGQDFDDALWSERIAILGERVAMDYVLTPKFILKFYSPVLNK